MSLADKSQENLAAGEALVRAGYFNAAASRLYYALFQAAVHVLEHELGKKPSAFRLGAKSWEHGIVASNARMVRDARSDRRLYEQFRSLREQADYQPTSVEERQITERIDAVGAVVREATGA